MSTLRLSPEYYVGWNGKLDKDDRDIRLSVAHELLTAFSNVNWDCQKIAEHATFRTSDRMYLDGCLRYEYSVHGTYSDAGVPKNFQFEYAGENYKVYVSIIND